MRLPNYYLMKNIILLARSLTKIQSAVYPRLSARRAKQIGGNPPKRRASLRFARLVYLRTVTQNLEGDRE
jgi:hypothetical protein